MNNKRDERYDFYKGLLMIGVVLGHVLTALQAGSGGTFLIHEFVRTYDMPMFAFLSGIFLKQSCRKRGPIRNILNKTGSILIPALVWSEIFGLLKGSIVPSTGGLWFLYAIFFSSVIIILIDRIRNSTLRLLAFIGAVIFFHTVIIDPFKTGFLLAPAIAGYYWSDCREEIKRRLSETQQKTGKFLLVFAFVIAQCFWKEDYSVWSLGCGVFDNEAILPSAAGIAFRFATGLLGCLVMKAFFEEIYFYLKTRDSTVCGKIRNRVVLWGRSTLELYILHAWFVSVAGAKAVRFLIGKIGYNPFFLNERLLVLVIAPAVTILTLFLMHFLSTAIRRIPFAGEYAFSVPIKLSAMKDKSTASKRRSEDEKQ